MLEQQSPEYAEPVVNVEPQESVEIEEVESDDSEVTTEQPSERPTQSKEDNAKFAEVRREAERKAQDRLISELYGDQGIHTKADYDKAIQAQRESEMLEQLRNEEADPSVIKDRLYKEWEKSDPRLQEYEKIKTENYVTTQLSELNADLKDMGLDAIKSLDDIAKLPSAEVMTRHIEKGKTLAEAYFLANKSEIIKAQASKIQQETIKKSALLDGASPGALDNSGGDTKTSVYNMSDADFQKMKEDALMGKLKR
jgi:hypothetical protein